MIFLSDNKKTVRLYWYVDTVLSSNFTAMVLMLGGVIYWLCLSINNMPRYGTY